MSTKIRVQAFVLGDASGLVFQYPHDPDDPQLATVQVVTKEAQVMATVDVFDLEAAAISLADEARQRGLKPPTCACEDQNDAD